MVRRVAIVAFAVWCGAVSAQAQETAPRVFDVQTLGLAARYRAIEDSTGKLTVNQVQQQLQVKMQVKADREGKLALNVGAFTGSSMTAGWNNTGIGTGTTAWAVRIKQLYVAAKPVKGVEAQFGGLYFNRGELTEITTYDNDAFFTGERVSVRRPDKAFFDEIAVTNGYIGNPQEPSMFERQHGLGDANYRQVLLAKKLSARAAVSADWSDAPTGTTWRAGATVKPSRAIDVVRLEWYARPDDSVQGGAVTLERKVSKRTVLSGGYANIDKDFGGLNADKFHKGARLFANAQHRLFGQVSASVYYTHWIDTGFAVPIARRFDVAVSWNALPAFQKVTRK